MTANISLLLFVISCFKITCQGEIFQIDNTRPFISVGGNAVQWHTGAASQWILSSSMVRIHPRGVFFKPKGWHRRDLERQGWRTVHCEQSAFGMCESTDGSIMFPSNQLPVINEDMDHICTSQNTARLITSNARYDVSSCDVLDAAMDFVFVNHIMHTAHTALPTWIYWTVCVLVVFLVRCLSKYVLSSLVRSTEGHSNINDNPWACLAACAVCVVLILSQGDWIYVTNEDLFFNWFVVFYVGVYACLFMGTILFRQVWNIACNTPPFYNLLSGVLQLVACRLYAGAETPYNIPLIFIIATRCIVKSRRGCDFLRSVTLLLDACMLSLSCMLGFSPDSLYLVAVFAWAGAWADFLV